MSHGLILEQNIVAQRMSEVYNKKTKMIQAVTRTLHKIPS